MKEMHSGITEQRGGEIGSTNARALRLPRKKYIRKNNLSHLKLIIALNEQNCLPASSPWSAWFRRKSWNTREFRSLVISLSAILYQTYKVLQNVQYFRILKRIIIFHVLNKPHKQRISSTVSTKNPQLRKLMYQHKSSSRRTRPKSFYRTFFYSVVAYLYSRKIPFLLAACNGFCAHLGFTVKHWANQETFHNNVFRGGQTGKH